MPLILSGNVSSALGTGYEVANSCRFDDGSSAKLTQTFGTPTTANKFTLSFWIKRSSFQIGTNTQNILNTETGNLEEMIRFEEQDRLHIFLQNSAGAATASVKPSYQFRDPAAWYHIVIGVDTTQSTDTNRFKFWVNGSRLTAFTTTTYVSQNYTLRLNTAVEHEFGVRKGGAFLDAYIAELVFIDGQQLDADQFGEYNEDSPTIWQPKDVTGLTFGNNGFYLDFEDSGDLGDDESGNGNDWTESGLAATDQSTDTCTNNFATWNPLFRKGTTTPAFAEGNLKSTFDDGGANEFALTTFGVSAGKWYAEVKWPSNTGTAATATGILDMAYTGTDDPNNAVTNAFGYFGSGTKNVSGTASSYGDSYADNDIIGIAIDMDNNKLYFSKNGTFQDSGDPTSGSTGTGAISIVSGVTYGIFASDYNSQVAELNTGSPPFSISSGNSDANGYGNFEYSVPSGYLALCTKNLGSDGG
jgi:hypothetical protein